MTSKIEQILGSGVNRQETLALLRRFEATHTPLPDLRRLMGKLGTVIGVLRCVVDRVRDQLPMRYAVAF